MNRVTLLGRLTKDAELRYTQSGTAVASFTVAVDKPGKDAGVDFINCTAWKKTAEVIGQYLSKGSQAAFEGRINTRNYDDKDGKKVYVTEVVVERMWFCGSKSGSAAGGGNGANNSNSSNSVDQGLGQEVMFDDNDLPF